MVGMLDMNSEVKGDSRVAYDLRDDERCAQPEAGAFGEAPAARPRHEDEGLADDAHLQVQGRHHLLGAATQRPHVEGVLHCHRRNIMSGS